jgi:hypothetical protein
MRYMRIFAIFGAFLVCASYASAQRVTVGVGFGGPAYGPAYVGPAPGCAYGYYSYYPYACAPYGYYGPSWFSSGLFIGAGPWYHGYERGYYGGHGFYGGRGYYGGPAYRSGPVGRGYGYSGRGTVGRGFHSFGGGAVRSGGAVRGGGGSFHGGGGSHAGGGHGGGRR